MTLFVPYLTSRTASMFVDPSPRPHEPENPSTLSVSHTETSIQATAFGVKNLLVPTCRGNLSLSCCHADRENSDVFLTSCVMRNDMRCMVPLKAALAQTLSDRVIVRGMRLCSLQRAYSSSSRYRKRSGGPVSISRGDTISHDIPYHLFDRPKVRLQSRLASPTD